MTLGEKIKQARLDRKMTQKDVVGDYITRNMLSKIENGSATPSIKTLEYLADVLGLPPGYFMADLPPENAASGIDGARTAYRRGDYKRAIELITMSDRGGVMSDEAYLLSAKCCAGLAANAFDNGNLTEARAYAREGLKHSAAGIYTDPQSDAECCRILMLYALRTSGSRDAEYERYSERLKVLLGFEGVAEQFSLIEALHSGKVTVALDELQEHWSRAVWSLVKGRELLGAGDIKGAVELLLEAEKEAEAHGGKTLREDIYAALEQAFSADEDYKQAYSYATKRLAL